MTTWQRRARLFVALFAVAFAIVVAAAFRQRPPVAGPTPLARLDPKAVVESTGGHLSRVRLSREDLSLDFEKQLTYADGRTKLVGVKVTTTNRGDGRIFTVTGKEGEVRENPSGYTVNGDVRLVASDGLIVKTEQATYADGDATVRAPGPVEFARGRMAGTGVGMTYEKTRDVLTILDQAVVHVAADDAGAGALEATAGTASFARPDRVIRFERDVRIERAGEVMQADSATGYLTEDRERIDSIELRGNSRVGGAKPAAGGLKVMTGRDMNLKYADGRRLQHLLVVGGAAIQLAAEAGKPGRRLTAEAIDTFVAEDGSTPTALAGRDGVVLTFPAESGAGLRTIRAASIDAIGKQGAGLTNAHFAGDVEYREGNSAATRTAKAATLDVALKPGMSSIDEAKFAGGVRFTDGGLVATATTARYGLEKGLLELGDTESSGTVPHVANEQIQVEAAAIAVVLVGPMMKATGNVKSVLLSAKKPEPKTGNAGAAAKVPAMLKQDQPVNVTAGGLDYDGTASKATYTGAAQLWQADTTVRAETLVVDGKNGDLSATGSVVTSVVFEQTKKGQAKGQTGRRERIRSLGTANQFTYEEAARRATYTGAAHLSGPEGDMTADKVELYLKAAGDELERAEAYDKVTLRESARRTTGNRVTYVAEDDRYIVSGTPVTVVDECNYETAGRTLTFHKATDTILVDGQKQFRTYTKGSGKCPGS